MIVEKVPSLRCPACGSEYVILADNKIECDDCNRVTANTSDLTKTKKQEVEKILTSNLREIIK